MPDVVHSMYTVCMYILSMYILSVMEQMLTLKPGLSLESCRLVMLAWHGQL